MNILKRELKTGLKPFLFWALGLFVLVFIGMVKSTGLSAGGDMISKLTQSFPRIVLAVMGAAGVDMSTFGGYYAVLAQYASILAAVYAVRLGNGAVSREFTDRTYEFIFTKPRSRSFILAQKLISGIIFLTLFCLLNFVFSAAAAASFNIFGGMTKLFALYSVSVWLIGLLFFSLGAMFAALCAKTERGTKYGNIAVLVAFALGIIYNMLENGAAIRFLTPFKYFLPGELIENTLSPVFAVACAVISIAALILAFIKFKTQDLKTA